MHNKRGQFYLLAAAIIIAIVLGLSTSSYVRTSSSTQIYDLGKDLKIETGQVLDYGVYNKQDNSDLIEDWALRFHDFSKYQGENPEDWIFVYGNDTSVYAYKFTKSLIGNLKLELGSTNVQIADLALTNTVKNPAPRGLENKIRINFNNYAYDFSLSRGQNFYFLIKSKKQVAVG